MSFSKYIWIIDIEWIVWKLFITVSTYQFHMQLAMLFFELLNFKSNQIHFSF